MQQFEWLSNLYNELIKTDPMKLYVQYPTVLFLVKKLLWTVKWKQILDIWCGNWVLARPLADMWASVNAYDDAANMVREAIDLSKDYPSITYFEANQYTFTSTTSFDLAFSNLVICYAKSKDDLKEFFVSTYHLLKPWTSFLSIIANPEYAYLGEQRFNRRLTRKDNSVYIDFLDKIWNNIITSQATDFKKADYEHVASQAGFSSLEWMNVLHTKDELKEYREWFDESPPYIVFIVMK